jgi:hypothetical protein
VAAFEDQGFVIRTGFTGRLEGFEKVFDGRHTNGQEGGKKKEL